MRIKICIILLFFLGASDLQAQHVDRKRVGKTFQKAVDAYLQKDYTTAEKWLDKSLRLDSTFAKAWLMKAEINREQHKPTLAIKAFQKLLKLDKYGFPQVYYSLGRLQFGQAEYRNAVTSLETFMRLSSASSHNLKIAQQLLKSARFAREAILHPVVRKLNRMSSHINSGAEEYINFVNEDRSRLLFTRKFLVEKAGQKGGYYKELFYETDRGEGGQWQTPVQMSFPWAKGLNMGGLSLSVDKQQMYFTACYWPGNYGSCDIYRSNLYGKQWLPPTHLGRAVNSRSWDSQACISSNGRLLFFASRRKGGKGGSDIWMSQRDSIGNWSPAVNLGDSINTQGNEMAPFLHPDGQTLYFSSNGRSGMGGYDLYISHRNLNGQWSTAKNLGYPVNTNADELNLFVSIDGNHAWLSSNRAGSMDIYQFKTYAAMRPKTTLFVKGRVEDAITGKILSAKVELTDLSNNHCLDSLWTNQLDGRFLMVLHPGEDVAFHIFKKGYLFYSKHFDLNNFPNQKDVSTVFRLSPIKKGSRMPLENILFNFDRSSLQRAAFAELKMVVNMLQQNPKIRMLIVGYTDSIGSSEHNLKLSKDRAKSVYDYLVAKGISPGRLSYKGFGSVHPLNSNKSEESRALNRRTEIIIQ